LGVDCREMVRTAMALKSHRLHRSRAAIQRWLTNANVT
jgi:hypothetical protein